MKSKKMLAQIAAFSLVFGMTGVVSSWADNTADEVVVRGTTVEQYDPINIVKVDNTLVDTATDGSLSITGKDVRGIWLTDGAKLTANNVNFNDKGTANEVGVENGSTLIVNGGSITAPMRHFDASSGSTISTDGTTITTGAFANNATITLKNSTTSGTWLYAGNAFPENENDTGCVAEGLPVGSITIDGGTASVKNVLVQNKGQFNVTNGAVLDVTQDLSPINTETAEIEKSATGITKGGEIVVRAWGPNTKWAEKGNSDSDPINKLDQVSTLAVDGATVKANKLTVEGKLDTDIDYFDSAAFTAKNSTVELASATLNSAKFYAENSQISIGDLHADDSLFWANNGTKAEIQKMTMDNGSLLDVGSYNDDDMVVKEAADVTVHQLDMKGDSTITIKNGKLNSDQITMEKSTIDIAGVGTLIANKMTLNNTKLSLSGIQNEVTTLALDADEDIQPLDGTQNGVTVEVTDTLAMNGGTLQVKDGSKLTTNQMKLANGSTVKVDGANSSYTIKGTDNTVSGDAKIAVKNGGSVTLAEGAGIKAEADANNKVKPIIMADAGSTLDVSKGSLYITNANKVGTVYDVSAAIQSEAENGGTENRGNEFKDIYGASRLVKAFANQNGQYIFKLNNDVISKDSPFSHIVNEAVKNEGKLNDLMNTAFGEGTPDDAQGNNALEHAAAIAEMAGVTHGTYGFAQDFSGMIADHKGEGSGIWANYLRQDKKVDGFQVAGRKAKYDVKYNGFLIGSDLISDENSRTGIAFAYADGSHTEKDGVTGKNDTKYYGGDVYHHFTAGGIQYKADIGFIKSDNDLEQTQLGTTIKGSVDGNAFFAGIRAEKEIALGASSLTPYAGLRYYRIHTGDFTDSLGMKHETENANLWNLPVGVEFRHEVKNGSWSLTPVAEIGYNFAMGDKDTKETVSLGNAADTFSFDIGESAFLARLGVEAENSTWTLGGGYRYQKGSDTQSNQWYIQAGYRF